MEWKDHTRDDTSLIPYMESKGWKAAFSDSDKRTGRTTPDNCPQDEVLFEKPPYRIWRTINRNTHGSEWRRAKLIHNLALKAGQKTGSFWSVPKVSDNIRTLVEEKDNQVVIIAEHNWLLDTEIIVKIQMAITSNDESQGAQIMVYNEDRKLWFEMPAPVDIIVAMAGRPKAYFEVSIHIKGYQPQIKIVKEIPAPKW